MPHGSGGEKSKVTVSQAQILLRAAKEGSVPGLLKSKY